MAKNNNRATYTNHYVREHYDRIMLLLPKGTKDNLKEAANTKGVSVNSYITALILAAGR